MYLEHLLESILKRRISLPFLEIISLHGFYTTILSFPRKRSKATREEQNKDTFINPTRLSSRRDSRYDAIYTRFVSFAILSSPWFFLLYPRFLQISLGGKKKTFPFRVSRISRKIRKFDELTTRRSINTANLLISRRYQRRYQREIGVTNVLRGRREGWSRETDVGSCLPPLVRN